MSLRDIKRRIRSVKLTKKITRAIQMVAASKVKTAQTQALATRRYRDELLQLMRYANINCFRLPAMVDEGKHIYIVFSSDRGLCGSYNSTLLRYVVQHTNKADALLITIGKKGFAALKSSGFHVLASFVGISAKPDFRESLAIARTIRDTLSTQPISRITIVYQKFINPMVQKPEMVQLYPAEIGETTKKPGEKIKFEPTLKQVTMALESHYLTLMLHQVMLEAAASEHSARMVAMEQASSNASDLIFDLTQGYNKLRQAAITTELIEIVSGSASLTH